MGLYRKYSEADLFEIMRLFTLIREKKAIRKIENDCLNASFHEESCFTIFYDYVKVLRTITEWLEQDEFMKYHDIEDNELENDKLRRIFFQLSKHFIKGVAQIPLKSSASKRNIKKEQD